MTTSTLCVRSKADICSGPIAKNTVPWQRIVAPVSTVLYVAKAIEGDTSIENESNIPKDKHWTECPVPGSVVLAKQPQGQICALVGDIIATRLKRRGILGLVAAGRIRDVSSCAAVCHDGHFQMWSQGFSAAAPSLEVKPWMVDVPVQVGQIRVNTGDIICVDESEMAIVVIPREHLKQIIMLLPVLKQASDSVLADVEDGLPLHEATKGNPDFYSNHK